jgi:proton glutamate symport protein
MIGLIAINISKAGVGLRPVQTGPVTPVAIQHQTASDIVLHIFPENIASSVAEGQVLQVVVFSLIFAFALSLLPQPRRAPLLIFCEGLSETMFKFTKIVMYLAAPAVGAAIASTIGQLGLTVLSNLLKLLATQYVALILFILLVLVPTAILVRIPLGAFTQRVSEPAIIAFATTSSEAALPRAMEEMEQLASRTI